MVYVEHNLAIYFYYYMPPNHEGFVWLFELDDRTLIDMLQIKLLCRQEIKNTFS